MKSKFNYGETVNFKGESLEVKSVHKDFLTKKFTYLLSSGVKVEESQLEKIRVKITRGDKNEAEKLYNAYEKAYKKGVPPNKKKNLDWIREKLEEHEAEVQKKIEHAEKWRALQGLDEEALNAFIIEKELEIDPNDYSDIEELRTAVAQELDIEIPE